MSDNKQSIYYIVISILMLCSAVYAFFPQKTVYVKDFKFTDEFLYTGNISKNFFVGEGRLETSDGTYVGNFEKGRFSENGKFTTKDGLVYEATFIPKEQSKNITITSKELGTYKFLDGRWEKCTEKK